MKVEISVPEVVSIFKEIQARPEKLFEMIRADIRRSVGEYLSELMDKEMTYFLGRERYERIQAEPNHRNGSYPRNFTLKGIGEVDVRVPIDREGDFKAQIISRIKRYEDELRQDLSMMFLTDVSIRTLPAFISLIMEIHWSSNPIGRLRKNLPFFKRLGQKNFT